ncbi:unnamed protein product [Rhodiola kirilowii]
MSATRTTHRSTSWLGDSSTEVRYTTAFSNDNPQACVIM